MAFRALTVLVVALVCGPSASLRAAALSLSLWDEEQPDIQAALDKQIGRFAAGQSAVTVRRSHFKTEDLRVQFQTGGMAGKGADLVLAPNDFAGVFAVMGLIQPVDSWAQMARFAPASKAAITDAKGAAWGLPINCGNHLILFVDKRRINPPPATIEALEAAAKGATDPAQRRFGLAYSATEPFWFVPFMAAFGGRPLVDGKPRLDTPAMVRALALVQHVKVAAKVTPADCDYACAETLFLDRKAAMTVNGDWAIGKYAAALKGDLAIAPLPRDAATGLWMEPMLSGKYLLFNARLKGERLAAAKAFAEFLVAPATQTALAQATKRLPSLAALTTAPVVRDDPLLAASEAALAHSQPMPMDVAMRIVWDAIRPQLQAVMAGRAAPAAAAGIMQRDAEAKIRELAH